MIVLLVSAAPASAQVRVGFEQRYFRHPGRQVWDFSIIRSDAVYHIFYHSIHETTSSATAADTIWHATSADLQRWELRGPVLFTAGAASWEQGALWAPSVVRDDDRDRWVMLYTGSDAAMNERVGLAIAADLDTWTRLGDGPVISPDTTAYIWSSAAASCASATAAAL